MSVKRISAIVAEVEVGHLGVEDQGVVDRTVENQEVVDLIVEDQKVKDLEVKDREMKVGSIMQTRPYNLQPLPYYLYVVKLGLIRVHFF